MAGALKEEPAFDLVCTVVFRIEHMQNRAHAVHTYLDLSVFYMLLPLNYALSRALLQVAVPAGKRLMAMYSASPCCCVAGCLLLTRRCVATFYRQESVLLEAAKTQKLSERHAPGTRRDQAASKPNARPPQFSNGQYQPVRRLLPASSPMHAIRVTHLSLGIPLPCMPFVSPTCPLGYLCHACHSCHLLVLWDTSAMHGTTAIRVPGYTSASVLLRVCVCTASGRGCCSQKRLQC